MRRNVLMAPADKEAPTGKRMSSLKFAAELVRARGQILSFWGLGTIL
jgi:hypothetical protein